jgi:hypothetical protein
MEAQAEKAKQAHAPPTEKDRVAQAETGDAEELIQFGEQDVGPHAFGPGRRRDGPKFDLSKGGAQLRIAHRLVPAASQPCRPSLVA